MNVSKKIGLATSSVHAALFLVTFFDVISSEEAQIQLLYIPFMILDLPVSLLYATPLADFDTYLKHAGLPFMAKMFYPPLIIHGILGSVWWYYVPKVFLPKRLGGIWGKKNKE